MTTSFGWLNYTVLGVYLSAMVLIGLRCARGQKTTEDYFLAGRRMPWLPVAMSMYASLTSAVSFMGLPAMAYAESAGLLVVCFVSPLLVPLLALVLYPAYRRHRVTTSYEFLGLVYGRPGRMAASGLFVLARLGWMGVVIYAPALALHVAAGIPVYLGILLMGVLATVYTVLGGLAAVLWTDVVQFVILVGGAVGVAVSLLRAAPDGFVGILAVAREAGHLNFGLRFSLVEMSALIVGVSFFLQMLQDYGTDQVTVQRLLAVKDDRGVVKAVSFNAVTDFVMIALLLFIGLGLFVFYSRNPALKGDVPNDSILPFYIMQHFPPGLSGLVISAIFAAAMSSMDSGINSLATVIDNDFVQPLRRGAAGGERDVRLARLLTLILGAASTAMAFLAGRIGHLIEAFATFMSLFNAPVLVLFVLAFMPTRTPFAAWLLGCAASIPATLWLQTVVKAHWVYYFPFSFALCFTVSWLAGAALGTRRPEEKSR